MRGRGGTCTAGRVREPAKLHAVANRAASCLLPEASLLDGIPLSVFLQITWFDLHERAPSEHGLRNTAPHLRDRHHRSSGSEAKLPG